MRHLQKHRYLYDKFLATERTSPIQYEKFQFNSHANKNPYNPNKAQIIPIPDSKPTFNAVALLVFEDPVAVLDCPALEIGFVAPELALGVVVGVGLAFAVSPWHLVNELEGMVRYVVMLSSAAP